MNTRAPVTRRFALACALLWELTLIWPAAAQPAGKACPAAEAIEPLHLYGLWQLRLWPEDGRVDDPASTGALLFEKHPDYPGSVRGELRRSVNGSDLQARLSGDVTDGVFNLDESDDGVSMSAVWTGDPVDCGRRITGTRRPAEGRPASEPVLRFELLRQAGW